MFQFQEWTPNTSWP